jgi:ABC-2 type transport system ATP-binding protein
VSEQPKFFDMTLINYLIYMGRLGHLSKSQAEKKAEELILWLGLEEAADRKVNNYSSGMKQKAALAQALIHEPEILILDEPTANLDPIGRAGMIKHILELVRDRGLTVFVSSHILGEVEQLADYVTIINMGKIILSDDVKSIKKHLTGNHYILETSKNDLIFKKLQQAPFIDRVWMDDEQNIQIISDKDDVLQEALPKMLFESKITLKSFKQRDISLENIFLQAVADEEKTQYEDGGEFNE